MRLLNLLVIASQVFAQCEPLRCVRKEWREMPQVERDSFHNAINRLRNQRSRLPAQYMSRSRWADFSYVHYWAGRVSHNAAIFLPWHRDFLWQFERIMRDEGGYRYCIPYWYLFLFIIGTGH
jgi:tyrosinase